MMWSTWWSKSAIAAAGADRQQARLEAAAERVVRAALPMPAATSVFVGLAVARCDRVVVGVEVADQDHRQAARRRTARATSSAACWRGCSAPGRPGRTPPRWVLTKRNQLTAADLGVDAGPAARHRQLGRRGCRPAAGWRSGPRCGLLQVDAGAVPLTRITSRIVRRPLISAFESVRGRRRHAVLVGGRLEVELVARMTTTSYCVLAFVQLAEQFLQVVVADRGRARRRVERTSRLAGPVRHSATSCRPTRSGCFSRISCARPLARVGKSLAVTSRRIWPLAATNASEAGRDDRRRQVGAEVEVAGHRVDDVAAAVVAVVALPWCWPDGDGRAGRARPPEAGQSAATQDESSWQAPSSEGRRAGTWA